jgi:hypothetical protein
MALYDPTPKVVSPDFSLSEFLAWARTKPAGERYCYFETGHCAVARFLRDTDRAARPNVGGTYWEDLALPFGRRPEHSIPEAARVPLLREPHTFGALAARIEAELAR